MENKAFKLWGQEIIFYLRKEIGEKYFSSIYLTIMRALKTYGKYNFMKKINSFNVTTGMTFFDSSFNVPKKFNDDFINFFNLQEDNLVTDIILKIDDKDYNAKVRLARINNSKKFKGRSKTQWKERNVIQIIYGREYNTLKALRKLFIYSYATTINNSSPELKETFDFIHIKDNQFTIKVISKQKSDFDDMFKFMEDKNLFKFWKEKDKKESENDRIILNYSQKWLSADKAKEYKDRNNVIYLLFHSGDNHLYIGKADNFGQRVKKGKGRIGLNDGWDMFMWFELNPEYNMFLEELEHFLIRTFASVLKSSIDVEPIIASKVELVNRILKKNKI